MTPGSRRKFLRAGLAGAALIGRGASVHGLPALRQMPGNDWLEMAMIRVNHNGAKMDAEEYNTRGLGNVSEVVKPVDAVRQAGVDSVTVGFKNTAEIDEAIENLNHALSA
jgi:hypothetical protein